MSSYISPAPQGDAKATGAYAVAIAATPGGTNNDGHATDSAGNVVVDFAWGNFPLQPNDVRSASPSYYATGGGTGDHAWGTTTDIDSGYLAFTNITKTLNYGVTRTVVPDSHELAESAYSNYPAFVAGDANYVVTAVSGDGTTVTYTSMNWLKPGDVVTITGCPNSVFNLASQTVVTATRQSFTVSNAAGAGVTVTGFYGKAQNPNAVSDTDGAYVGGVAYVNVPNVARQTVASATDAMKDAELGTITNTTGTVQIAKSYRAGGGGLTKITTSEPHGFLAGDVVVVAGTNGNPDLEGEWTIIDVPTPTTFRYQTTTEGTITEADDTGTCKVAALAGKIWKQSPAAGASSVAVGAAVTLTAYAS